MAVTYHVLMFFNDTISKLGWDLKGKKICSLGNDEFSGNRVGDYLKRRPITVKDYYTELGLNYTSIDINGLDGALKLDLCEPITDTKLLGNFDIVTNFGTSEHVSNDEGCFNNIDHLTKAGGVMIHAVPTPPNYNHGLRSYTLDFFTRLSESNGYTILNSIVLDCIPIGEYTVDKIIMIALQKGGGV